MQDQSAWVENARLENTGSKLQGSKMVRLSYTWKRRMCLI